MQSIEGASLVDVQVTALFGNLKELQEQMQSAVGQNATSIEELMQKVQVCAQNAAALNASGKLSTAAVQLYAGCTIMSLRLAVHAWSHSVLQQILSH